jgi:hypothetical protein
VRNNKQDGGEQQPKMMENKSLYQGEHESIRRGRTTWTDLDGGEQQPENERNNCRLNGGEQQP